eukprot:PhM_4_TR8472/c0_g1_i1/m.104147
MPEYGKLEAAYVRKHGLGSLMRGIIASLEKERPENMRSFVCDVLKAKLVECATPQPSGGVVARRPSAEPPATLEPLVINLQPPSPANSASNTNTSGHTLQPGTVPIASQQPRRSLTQEERDCLLRMQTKAHVLRAAKERSNRPTATSNPMRAHIVSLVHSLPEDKLIAVAALMEKVLAGAEPTLASPTLTKRHSSMSRSRRSGGVGQGSSRRDGSFLSPMKPSGLSRSHRKSQQQQQQQGNSSTTLSLSSTCTSVVTAPGQLRRAGVSARPAGDLGTVVAMVIPTRVVPKTVEEEARAREALLQNPLFSTMQADAELDSIIKALQRESFKGGTDILVEGAATPEKLYLIVSGTVDIVKGGKWVMSFKPGCTFGEHEMIHNIPTCAATVRCVTDLEAFSLDNATYQSIVLSAAVIKRKQYRQLIDSVNILQELPDYNKMCLAEALTTTRFQKDNYVIRFGQAVDTMYIVMEGTMKVIGRQRGQKLEIATVQAGGVVGELEFLFSGEAVADVIAVERTKCAQLTRAHYEMILGPVSTTLKKCINSPYYSYFRSETNDVVRQDIEAAQRNTRSNPVMAPTSPTYRSQHTSKVQNKFNNIAPPPQPSSTSESVLFPIMHNDESDADGADEESDGAPAVYAGFEAVPALAEGEIMYPLTDGHLIRFSLEPLEGANVCVFGMQEDGKILHWNACMERITGFSAEEMCGHSIYSVLADNTSQEDLHSMISAAGAMSHDLSSPATLLFAKKSMTRTTTMSMHVIPSRLSMEDLGVDGPEVVLCIGAEVTDGPRSTLWLPHQIGGAVNEVLSLLDDYAATGFSADGDGAHAAPQLARASELLRSLAWQLDAITSTRKAHDTDVAQNIDVRALLGGVATTMTSAAVHKKIKFVPKIAPDVPSEVYLPDCIERILTHLARNAVKHSPTGGSVGVSVSVVNDKDTSFLHFQVDDEGPGVPDSVVESVMRHSVISGMASFRGGKSVVGAGLCHMRTLARRVGATLQYNRGGVGASWTVSIVLVENMGGAHPSRVDSQAALGLKQNEAFTTVLIEDAVHRNVLCRVLWERKHAVVPGSTWSDVLRSLDTADIVIVNPDVLPPGDGDELQDFVAQHAKKNTSIIISGDVDRDKADTYRSAGIFVLSKPCTMKDAHDIFAQVEDAICSQREVTRRMDTLRAAISKEYRGEWERGELLGRGANGCVYQVTDVLTKGTMAMKVIPITVENESSVLDLLHEIEVMTKLQHDNVIQYFHLERGQNTLNIFMEHARGGSLESFIRENGTLSTRDIATVTCDILEGIAYLHSQRMVHCDLKPQNILRNGKWKIGDFGTAKQLKDGELLHDMRGTVNYMAPEVMEADAEHGYGLAVDIWSLGCVVMEMASGVQPFAHLVRGGNAAMGLMRYLCDLEGDPDLSAVFGADPFVFEFVRMCMRRDPTQRATVSQLRASNLLSQSADAVSMNAAMRILSGAKLLHRLEAFVAFAEDDGTGSQVSGSNPNSKGTLKLDDNDEMAASLIQMVVSPPVKPRKSHYLNNNNTTAALATTSAHNQRRSVWYQIGDGMT